MQMVRLVYGHITFMHKRPVPFLFVAHSLYLIEWLLFFFLFKFYRPRGKIWSVYGKIGCRKSHPPTTIEISMFDQMPFHVSLLYIQNGKQMPLHSSESEQQTLKKSGIFCLSHTCWAVWSVLFSIYQWLYLLCFFFMNSLSLVWVAYVRSLSTMESWNQRLKEFILRKFQIPNFRFNI